MKTIFAGAALAALISAPAFAQGNSGVAKGMAETLSSGAVPGSAAAGLSGNRATGSPSNSGWGNAGSELSEPVGTSVTDGAKSQGNGGAGASGGASDAK